MKSKLLRKIIISILGVASFIYIIVISLIISDSYFTLKKNTRNFLTQNSLNISRYFMAILESDINVVKTLKSTIKDFPKLDSKEREKLEEMIYTNVLHSNSQLLSIGRSWEIWAIDSSYVKPYGRYRILAYWYKGKILIKRDTLDIEGDNITSLYYQYKISKKPGLTPIYTDTYTGREEDKILMTTIVEPIIRHGYFIGAIYADISLERFRKILQKINPIEENKMILISQNGKIIASTDKEKVLTPFSILFGKTISFEQVNNQIITRDTYTFTYQDSLKNKYFVVITPIRLANYDTHWMLLNLLPTKFIDEQNKNLLIISLIGSVVGFILLILLSLFLAYNIITPLNEVTYVLKELSDRNIEESLKLDVKTNDEIGEIAKSVNELIDALTEITDFANEIGKGNLSVELKLAGERDILGKALLQMQKSLKIAQIEDKKRQEEEKIQRWIIEGEAKFAEIMRQYANDFEKLTYETIKNLVNYVEAQQGGLFVINDEDPENPYLELVASYAYGRRKFLKKTIPFGVGLVGRVVLEGETIYLTDLPEDYSNIISGLGETKPNSLIIVPFKFNEVIYAVAEIASMYEMKPYQRQFIERVGVAIASTIANMKITLQTNKLLEELKRRTQELSTQEEEMRQNMEEMRVTQEEMKRKNQELENIVNALYQIAFVLEYDMDRRLINVNKRFLDFLGIKKEDILYTKLGAYMADPEKEKILDELWHNIKLGRSQTLIQHHIYGNREFWFSEAYIPIFDQEGKPFKVINIIIDITDVMKNKKQQDNG